MKGYLVRLALFSAIAVGALGINEARSDDHDTEMIGTAIQARVRVVEKCDRVIRITEQREGNGPWKVIDREVTLRECKVPTQVGSGL